jgi:Fic/DOC family
LPPNKVERRIGKRHRHRHETALVDRFRIGTRQGISTIIEVAARAHNEWVHIHPFANGNGRTARSWANFVFARYTLRPPFRVRPRPGGGYEEAASEGMLFNDVPMRDFIGEQFVRQATQSIFKS